jgi:hypothetical protein
MRALVQFEENCLVNALKGDVLSATAGGAKPYQCLDQFVAINSFALRAQCGRDALPAKRSP